MITKSAIIILLTSVVIFVTPVIAVESTGSSRPAREKIDTRKVKIETRAATREAKITASMDERKTKMATKEAALKAKLQTFRDKKKAETAERVSINLDKINQNHTAAMLKHLDKMSALLDKLETRVTSATSDIKDPAAAKAGIADAKAIIATTSAAVKVQAEKDYTIQVTTEAKVKTDAQTKREELRSDLTALRKQVIDAKQAVSNAIKAAKSAQGVKEENSGQQ